MLICTRRYLRCRRHGLREAVARRLAHNTESDFARLRPQFGNTITSLRAGQTTRRSKDRTKDKDLRASVALWPARNHGECRPYTTGNWNNPQDGRSIFIQIYADRAGLLRPPSHNHHTEHDEPCRSLPCWPPVTVAVQSHCGCEVRSEGMFLHEVVRHEPAMRKRGKSRRTTASCHRGGWEIDAGVGC
jgi:hypothetical protein